MVDYKYKPLTTELRERIERILIEEVNRADINHINRFIIAATDKLVEIMIDEIKYGRRV